MTRRSSSQLNRDVGTLSELGEFNFGDYLQEIATLFSRMTSRQQQDTLDTLEDIKDA